MKNISLIVAVAENGVIGDQNKLLWHLPGDLKRFKLLTMGHYIIMGRKTFESIGKPLPGRTSIVISRNPDWKFEGVISAVNIHDAIEQIDKDDDEPFIIGGAEIYKQALPFVSKIYLSRVMASYEGDAFFHFENNGWVLLSSEEIPAPDEEAPAHIYEVWERVVDDTDKLDTEQ